MATANTKYETARREEPGSGRVAPFVDEVVAGDFLSIEVKFLLKLARLGHIPAHPIGVGSRRKMALPSVRTEHVDGVSEGCTREFPAKGGIHSGAIGRQERFW